MEKQMYEKCYLGCAVMMLCIPVSYCSLANVCREKKYVLDLESQCWSLIVNENLFTEDTAFALFKEARLKGMTPVMDIMVILTIFKDE